jgi:hypothetical protein
MEEETVIVIQKSDTEKALGTVGTSRAKITNNPLGAIGGGVLAWYLTKRYTGLENKWAYAGIILIGVVTGAYTMSAIKRTTFK